MTKHLEMLVDTDAGVDDCLALFVLRQIAPASAIDLAVTFGNVSLDQAISNVALLTSVSGLAVRKVLRGSSAPLSGEPHFATEVHGPDGLGGITNLPPWLPPLTQPTDNLFSATKLGIYENIVTLGPMTDLARLTSSSSVVPPLFVMGGAFGARGNISPFAEFNFYSDPGAANCVFERYNGEIFIVPLDVCNTIVLGRKYFGDLCDKHPSYTTAFLKLIHQHYMDFYRKVEGIDGCHPHDTLAICAAVEIDLFEWTPGWVRVLLEGPERGRSLFEPDPAGRHHVARAVDASRFFGILERAFISFKEARAPNVRTVG